MRWLALALLLAGCTTVDTGPRAIECKGKATVTATGAGLVSGAGTITFDCGDGAFIRRAPEIVE